MSGVPEYPWNTNCAVGLRVFMCVACYEMIVTTPVGIGIAHSVWFPLYVSHIAEHKWRHVL
jgi:hypothetical protein